MHELNSLRRAIGALANSKQRRRYPASLRARLVALVDAHPERSVASIARALDMAPQTLERIVAPQRPAALVPVHIVDADDAPSVKVAAIRVHGPRGIVVDGLDVADVAELIRVLS